MLLSKGKGIERSGKRDAKTFQVGMQELNASELSDEVSKRIKTRLKTKVTYSILGRAQK